METKKTILIADTSEEFRTVLAEAIQAEEGLEVVGQTGDGQEAIQLVQDRDPDVLVMDLVLERMDGFDVLEAVKARPMSTLILSSFARGCMADQVAARGGDYYMMKPCRIASVVERVRLLAAQHWSEGEEGAASPSPRSSTPKWPGSSAPPHPGWSGPSATPSKSPGTGATWTPCKNTSASPSAIPRVNPPTPSSSP